MAHEILKNDEIVLHKRKAWHNLGVVVEDAPTPMEALTLAKLDWEVGQKDLYTINGIDKQGADIYMYHPSHVMNYRKNTGEEFGIVSEKYTPIQNKEMAEFCEALGDPDAEETAKILCESAGSVRNGRRVWFLLKGEPFDVAKGDEIWPYILVSNGHDGLSSFRITPTTIRVVCSNTLHAVIPNYDTGQLGSSALSIKHFSSIKSRLEEAKLALKQYDRGIDATKELTKFLCAKEMNSDEMKQFFMECYAADFGKVPAEPKDAKEMRIYDRAIVGFNTFKERFESESNIAGTNAWNAFNSYSGYVQHDRSTRGDEDKQADSNLFGVNQTRTQAALKRAFALSS